MKMERATREYKKVKTRVVKRQGGGQVNRRGTGAWVTGPRSTEGDQWGKGTSCESNGRVGWNGAVGKWGFSWGGVSDHRNWTGKLASCSTGRSQKIKTSHNQRRGGPHEEERTGEGFFRVKRGGIQNP